MENTNNVPRDVKEIRIEKPVFNAFPRFESKSP